MRSLVHVGEKSAHSVPHPGRRCRLRIHDVERSRLGAGWLLPGFEVPQLGKQIQPGGDLLLIGQARPPGPPYIPARRRACPSGHHGEAFELAARAARAAPARRSPQRPQGHGQAGAGAAPQGAGQVTAQGAATGRPAAPAPAARARVASPANRPPIGPPWPDLRAAALRAPESKAPGRARRWS